MEQTRNRQIAEAVLVLQSHDGEGSECFAKHAAWHREQANGGGGN
jgi:hypothetical protein